MINGAVLVGAEERQRDLKFLAIDPAKGVELPTAFSSANEQDVADACALAAAAFERFSTLEPEARARFIEAVGDNILAIGDELIVTAMTETGLPRVRLEGERGRTVGQLKLFAQAVRQGDWLDAAIDPALPERTPPRADLRRMNLALGPVAVFGASNFPLAFSTAGGDTAAAFAAGCPVVVKGHPAHPGTGELVARAVQAAVAACGLPAGVFSFLPGTSNDLGSALVADPRIKAVGFTGSRGGGLALVRIANARAEPIPVYAEMSSINPVVLLPGALAARAEALGPAFVQSLTLGAGQFCTNPGLVIALDGPDLDRFVAAAAQALAESHPAVMLTPGIRESFTRGVDALAAHSAVTPVAQGRVGEGQNQACGALFSAAAPDFLADPTLSHEVFGASSMVVRCRDLDEMLVVIEGLEGQLTATLQLDAADQPAAARLLPALQRKAGRVLANGWPTGVEVTHAMVHGGPFPATSDGRSTSVGTLAMARFLRPVCYQDLPDPLLPPALQAANPWKLARRIDGVVERV
ncbi:aldehyde dehydrogenase (NADP(+)) [Phenylobacterium sp. LjRoot219]|uniref:aldehyde dehydrogenase (NADP(+)) n=1 Tax=Phenylobacterium sp. LjRoot219 TaxID=3342283 RepID=UPI003ED10DAB